MTVVKDLEAVSIECTPATVAFKDYDSFVKNVERAVALYSSVDLEETNISEVKQARTELNKLIARLETERKEVKKQVNSPYETFIGLYAPPYEKLQAVASGLKKQIDAYDDEQKKLRKSTVSHYLENAVETVLAETQVQLDAEKLISEYADNFIKVSDFKKDSFVLTKKTTEQLDALVLAELDKEEKRLEERELIKQTCQKYALSAYSYLEHHKNGKSLPEIFEMIEHEREHILRLEAEIAAKKQAELERQKELEETAKRQAKETIKAYDSETGEILEEADEPVYDVVLKFTLTQKQALSFRELLEKEGIAFEVIQKMKEVEHD